MCGRTRTRCVQVFGKKYHHGFLKTSCILERFSLLYADNNERAGYRSRPHSNTGLVPPDILVSAWVTDKIAIEPSVGILAYTNYTFWRLGFAVVNHFGQEKLSPFVLFRAKTYLSSASGRKSSDYLLGLACGGEYFVSDKFSVSGEVQLNYPVPDKEQTLFVRRNTIMTGVGIGARFYLN
jgi:hypothetical protein